MKILSMTATFGKLNGETLTLQPGMNIIHLPNEGGKSTWCAFLEAMLYGIDTGSRNKSGFLADKEHYLPWSGVPMSGSMRILWKNRDITIERRGKNRIPMGEVNAYETESGLIVPELCVDNCGEVLLGVERSVFVRAGFLKQSQMPVTEDEKLRRRLNDLVTTGDESGQSDMLAQKLKDLKNRCRFNKKGLLPEAEKELADVEQKLQQLLSLQGQVETFRQRETALKEENRLLDNHLSALSYQENLAYTQKLEAARLARDEAKSLWEREALACQSLPSEAEIGKNLAKLASLRDIRENLTVESQNFAPLPEVPYGPEVFRGKNPETAVSDAALDYKVLTQLQKDKGFPIPQMIGGILIAVSCVLAATVPAPIKWVGCGLLALCGILLIVLGIQKSRKLQAQIDALMQKYYGLAPIRWVEEAGIYARSQNAYLQALSARQTELADYNRRKEENREALCALTGDLTPLQYEQECQAQSLRRRNLRDLEEKYRQAEALVDAMSSAKKEVSAPTFPDTLSLSVQETKQKRMENDREENSLRHQIGVCLGQMETLGAEQSLKEKKNALNSRIDALETHYAALTLALENLDAAARELQRRFAPRISQKAQEFFARLTGNRYNRLTLCQDLSLETAAEGETTLRSSLWRSEGTVDQLYLALRLAVSQELTPNAPVILDDALVRFDDVRMATAIEILKEESIRKQVILFTCQKRETEI